MQTDLWNPEQYERFKEERSRPFYDLLALVERNGAMRILDLGCGTGELTAELHATLGAASTLGIDSSAAMLEGCAAFAHDGLAFERGDVTEFTPDAPVDLIFSNACLQWIDDHERVLERLARHLAPGGQIAVQVPANFDQETHAVAAELACEEPFKSALKGYTRRQRVPDPAAYARFLHRIGCGAQSVATRVYPHLLPSRAHVVEWVKGTLLTAYQRRLPAALWSDFVTAYAERLAARCPDARPFFFPFKRTLLWGRLSP